MKRDCSTLNNARDQRRDLFDNEDLVKECAAVPPAVHEMEKVDETIILEVDEEDEHESFEHADDLSTPALFDNEAEESTNRDEQDHEGASNEVMDTWDDNPMDAITTDATAHQGIVAEPIFNFVLDNLS
jgi:hypothetical protein